MIEELKRFLIVAKEGNITRAAQKIFITQSALSQSIQRLEKELHAKLFRQTGKQIQLTQDGQSIVTIGEKILTLWINAHDPQIRKTQTQTYSVGMFDNVALQLGKFLTDEQNMKPYTLELTIDASGKLQKQLQLGTLDAAVCILNETLQVPSHIKLIKTYSEILLPVSSRTIGGKTAEIPFILYNRGSHTRIQIDKIFTGYGIQPLVYAESTSVTFMRELALLGYGVALLPENFVKDDLDQERLKTQKMSLQWKRKYGFFVQKTVDSQSPFISELQAELAKLDA